MYKFVIYLSIDTKTGDKNTKAAENANRISVLLDKINLITMRERMGQDGMGRDETRRQFSIFE